MGPYKNENLIQDDCISCKLINNDNNNNNNNNNYYDDSEMLETCEMIYEESGKCEEHVSGYLSYQDNSSCALIDQIKYEQKMKTFNILNVHSATINKATTGALLFFVMSTI